MPKVDPRELNALANRFKREADAHNIGSPFRIDEYIKLRIKGLSPEQALAKVKSKDVKASSPVVQDAERRVVANTGMPFPVSETSKDRAHQICGECASPKEKTIPLSLIVATQRDFDVDHVCQLMHQDSDEPIDVAQIDGRYYIDDGHHRAAAAKFAGRGSIKARIAS